MKNCLPVRGRWAVPAAPTAGDSKTRERKTMAFMTTTPPGSSEDRTPVLSYNASAGRMSTRDRTQDVSGEWTTQETDVTMAQPAFALDFGRLEVGWVLFQKGMAPLWAMVPYGQPVPQCPASPGNGADGKALRYRQGFRVPVFGPAIGGVRELAGNASAFIAGMNELHTLFEATPEARAGKIPVVRMVNVLPVKSGQAVNYQPVFQAGMWVDRPAALGERTVPAPGGAPVRQVAPVPPATPPAPVPAPMTPPPAAAWGDFVQAPAMPLAPAAPPAPPPLAHVSPAAPSAMPDFS